MDVLQSEESQIFSSAYEEADEINRLIDSGAVIPEEIKGASSDKMNELAQRAFSILTVDEPRKKVRRILGQPMEDAVKVNRKMLIAKAFVTAMYLQIISSQFAGLIVTGSYVREGTTATKDSDMDMYILVKHGVRVADLGDHQQIFGGVDKIMQAKAEPHFMYFTDYSIPQNHPQDFPDISSESIPIILHKEVAKMFNKNFATKLSNKQHVFRSRTTGLF